MQKQYVDLRDSYSEESQMMGVVKDTYAVFNVLSSRACYILPVVIHHALVCYRLSHFHLNLPSTITGLD